ncbi:sensor domain-containing protein [Arhodomonas aquaeolei]|uniref:sensor domain-containing protein n=1 Tax=Arhodomonas aquaeolei TaxID=2369 RepID=UPI0003753F1F|nr:EAL domain-containing protein [Arhodomonas aquaeolei]
MTGLRGPGITADTQLRDLLTLLAGPGSRAWAVRATATGHLCVDDTGTSRVLAPSPGLRTCLRDSLRRPCPLPAPLLAELPGAAAIVGDGWIAACTNPGGDDEWLVVAGPSAGDSTRIAAAARRRRQHRRLATAVDEAQTVLDALPFPVFYKDESSRYRGCNRSFAEVVSGAGPAGLVGYHPDRFLSQEHLATHHEIDQALWRGEHEELPYELAFDDGSGTPREVRCHKRLTRTGHGERLIVGALLDVSDHRRTERALQASEARLYRFIEESPDAYFLLDETGVILRANRGATRLTGADDETLVGAPLWPWLGATDPRAEPPGPGLLDAAGGPQCLEAVLRHADGEAIPVELRISEIADDGATQRLCVATDIRERHRAQARMRRHERMFRDVFEASEDAILILDGDRFVECNQATLDVLGARHLEREAVLPFTPWDVSPPTQPDGTDSRIKAQQMIALAHYRHFHRFEWLCRGFDGQDIPIEATMTTIAYNGRTALYTVCVDISERRRHEEEAFSLAYYDPLTGLPNRRLLQRRAVDTIREHQAGGRSLGVLYLDLDRFKDINDTQGHKTGDGILATIADRLADRLRPGDTLARLGGDEFAVLCPDCDAAVLDEVVDDLGRAFESPLPLAGGEVRLDCSIGGVLCPQDGTSLDALLQHADIAMYEAKAAGRRFMRYAPHHGAAVQERVQLEQALARAVEQDALTLWYQPRVCTRSGRIESVEALARWIPADGVAISPGRFIPLAEQTGLIVAIGAQLRRRAAHQARAWAEQGYPLRMAVNISPLELEAPRFAEEILATIDSGGLDPAQLELEITEGTFMRDPERNAATLSRLRSAGVHITIDDFGIGYSSLSHLKCLPVDTLKLDRSLINQVDEDAHEAAIVQAVLALADRLSLNVIAEGMETASQAAALDALGCTLHQGFHYAHPVQPEAFPLGRIYRDPDR